MKGGEIYEIEFGLNSWIIDLFPGGIADALTSESLDRLVQALSALRDQSQHPLARNGLDEEAAYDSYMNPEPGFKSGPGDFVFADYMAPCLC